MSTEAVRQQERLDRCVEAVFDYLMGDALSETIDEIVYTHLGRGRLDQDDDPLYDSVESEVLSLILSKAASKLFWPAVNPDWMKDAFDGTPTQG